MRVSVAQGLLGAVGGLTVITLRPGDAGFERFRRESELRIWICRGLKGVGSFWVLVGVAV